MARRLKDPGRGISGESLHFWRTNRHRLGDIVDAEITFPGLGGEPPYHGILRDARGNEILLSGVASGYRGAGPRAAVTILTEAGFAESDAAAVLARTRVTLRQNDPGVERERVDAAVPRDRLCPLRLRPGRDGRVR